MVEVITAALNLALKLSEAKHPWPTIDRIIRRLTKAQERRFRRQRAWWLGHGMPMLKSLIDVAVVKESLTTREASVPTVYDAAVTRAVDTLNYFVDGAANQLYEGAIQIAVAAGAEQSKTELGSGLNFHLKSDGVQRYLQEHSGEKLGRDVDQTTKDRLRALLVDNYEKGSTYRQTVKDVKALYQGFTARTPGAVIKSRAELIAVTEMGNAFSEGALQYAKQLQMTGAKMEKMSMTSIPCDLCASNGAAGWIPLDQNFPSGADRPLFHVRCRCAIATRVAPPS